MVGTDGNLQEFSIKFLLLWIVVLIIVRINKSSIHASKGTENTKNVTKRLEGKEAILIIVLPNN